MFSLPPLNIVLPSREDKDCPPVDLDLQIPLLCFRPPQLLQVSHSLTHSLTSRPNSQFLTKCNDLFRSTNIYIFGGGGYISWALCIANFRSFLAKKFHSFLGHHQFASLHTLTHSHEQHCTEEDLLASV